ncbi:TetR/AcrR family transcriptional regulator [Kribbella deserti]|uniref:TetR/AcrR family transcriptional regulator n=1 Tax=Kribbella deserti TaxID=1926257 RepID=A0ABV6QSQ6_9ACTN
MRAPNDLQPPAEATPTPPAEAQASTAQACGTGPVGESASSARAIPVTCARPTRADAARNYDLLVTAAREAFADHGTSTSLEEIARRAGVGIGTLYRRFPTRTALLEAVYVDEIQSVCDRAYGFSEELPPFEALSAWLHSLASYAASKHTLASELMDALGKDSEFFKACKVNLRDAADLLFGNAKQAGMVRDDVQAMDVLRLISATHDTDADQAARLINIILAGLRPQPN